MTTAELTQWEVVRGRLDVTIAEQDKTIARLREKISDWRAHLVAFTFAADPSEEGWKESAGDIANEMQAALEDTHE